MIRRVVFLCLCFLSFTFATPLTARAADPLDAAGGEAAPAPQPESFLRWMARASGPIGVVILAMSFYLIALGVVMAREYRPTVVMPPALIHEVNELVAAKRFSEAYAKLCLDTSFLARTLASGCGSSRRA